MTASTATGTGGATPAATDQKPGESTEGATPAVKDLAGGTGDPASGKPNGNDDETLTLPPDAGIDAWKAYAKAVEVQAKNRKEALARVGQERDLARQELETLKMAGDNKTLEQIQTELTTEKEARTAAEKAASEGLFENEWLKVRSEVEMADADLAFATLPREKIEFDEKTKRPTNLKKVLEEHLTAHPTLKGAEKKPDPKPIIPAGAKGNGQAAQPVTHDALKGMTAEEIIANRDAVKAFLATTSKQ